MYSSQNQLFRKEIDRLHMNISEMEYVNLEDDWYYSTHKPSFTRIYAVIEGKGVIYCQGKEIPMVAGNIYILPAGLDVGYKCLTRLTKLYFHVNILQYNTYDMFYSMKSPAVISDVSGEIDNALCWLKQNDIYGVMQLKTWLMSKVLQGFEMTGTELGHIPEYSPLVKQVIQYVESHLRSAMTVSKIAADLYVSESRLQKAFKAEVGCSLGRFITDRLFFKAEQELRTTDRSIKEISEELGFCDPFYFSRRFTERYGASPSAYRKNNKKA